MNCEASANKEKAGTKNDKLTDLGLNWRCWLGDNFVKSGEEVRSRTV